MALCRSCQRDPDEWDREMRRLAGEADYYKRIAQAYRDVAESRLCPLTRVQEVALWERVNEYAGACGGDTSNKTVSDRRMDAVAALNREVEAIKAYAVHTPAEINRP